jgi:hypothetical protein
MRWRSPWRRRQGTAARGGGGRGRPPTEEKAGDVRRLQAAAAKGIDVKKKKTGSIRRIGLVGWALLGLFV